MENFAQLGVGGCFCIGVLKLVFDFLESRERKRQKEERLSSNGSGPESRMARAMETVAQQCELQTAVLKEIRQDQRRQNEATSNNGRLLGRIEDKLDILRAN